MRAALSHRARMDIAPNDSTAGRGDRPAEGERGTAGDFAPFANAYDEGSKRSMACTAGVDDTPLLLIRA
jgi:hypothetical protein